MRNGLIFTAVIGLILYVCASNNNNEMIEYKSNPELDFGHNDSHVGSTILRDCT